MQSAKQTDCSLAPSILFGLFGFAFEVTKEVDNMMDACPVRTSQEDELWFEMYWALQIAEEYQRPKDSQANSAAPASDDKGGFSEQADRENTDEIKRNLPASKAKKLKRILTQFLS